MTIKLKVNFFCLKSVPGQHRLHRLYSLHDLKAPLQILFFQLRGKKPDKVLENSVQPLIYPGKIIQGGW